MIKKFILLNIYCIAIIAQVNTETYRHNNYKAGNHHSISFSGAINSGTSTYYSISNEYQYNYLPKAKQKLRHLFVSKYNYSKNETSTIKNNLFFHYRVIKQPKSNNSLELFVQNESDNFKELKNRVLFGISKRKSYSNPKKIMTTFALGMMYELEKYSSQESQSKSIRMTNNLIITKHFSKTLKVFWVNYYQPKITNISNYRILSVLEIKNKVSEKIDYSTILNIDFDSNTPKEFSPSNLNISQKIKFKI